MTADRLPELIAEVLGIAPEQIGEDAAMGVTPNWDSLRNLQIVMVVECAFAVRLAFSTFAEVHSLAGLRALLHRHGIDTKAPGP